MTEETQVQVEGQTTRPPSRSRLALIVGGAVVVATVVTVGFLLPAEFQVDPTGFGRATGLYKLGTPQPKTATVAAGTTSTTREYPTPYRTDTIDIPLAAGGDENRGDELEYKVQMKAGDSFVYSWSVAGIPNPEEFYYDFHGETPAGPGVPEAKVVEYKQATGTGGNGTLIAPIPGVHGWYLQNQSRNPVVVKLKLSGFYNLVPPGGYGNLNNIEANKPVAAAAR
ncbi:MAG: hypothetical protein B7Y99_00250 [Caulobacterales bacterium 32-69-10]|nr:MAG: hypothetical protein B7Y99_00250 [Caulobacterales bacterium 32-69-10]